MTVSMAAAQAWLSQVSEQTNNYAGIPMPLDGVELTVHKKHPLYEIYQPEVKPLVGDSLTIDGEEWKFRSVWRSRRRKATIIVLQNQQGRCRMLAVPEPRELDLALATLANSAPWTLNAETTAMQKLAELITAHQFQMYILTGSFVESSKRSKVSYLFRRCRPTVALREQDGTSRVLCALCLHPIGFYNGSHAGVMVPTDDVIAHLLLMRGAEPKLWHDANQHLKDSPLAGLNC